MTQGHDKTLNRAGLLAASIFGAAAIGLVAISTPFLLPALRKHCLPYVPATNNQLVNLKQALKKHSVSGDKFIDIGSGDGRICRLAAELDIYTQVHGVELNGWLVLYSRLKSLRQSSVKFYKNDFWRFPLGQYESICIFGVDTMMDPLERYLLSSSVSKCRRTIFACRFPFSNMKQIDEIGSGIDTVWVYEL